MLSVVCSSELAQVVEKDVEEEDNNENRKGGCVEVKPASNPEV